MTTEKQAAHTPEPIDIVFDGPPGPESGRFVEVEQGGKGMSVRFGKWVERDDGYWVLRLPDPYSAIPNQLKQLTETTQLIAKMKAALKVLPKMKEALQEIAKGEGAFSRDPLQHAENVIEEAKKTAKAALAAAQPKILHKSDCAMHNEPAFPKGLCDCGVGK